MSFTQVTVTGTIYLAGTVKPAIGAKVNMTLSSYITDGDSVITPSTPQTATCDSTGAFALSVVANDDPTTTPTGTYYTVVITSPTGGSTLDNFTTVVSYKNAPSINVALESALAIPMSLPTSAEENVPEAEVKVVEPAVVAPSVRVMAFPLAPNWEFLTL